MCHFLSVVVDSNCRNIYPGNLLNHSSVEEIHGLKPGSYHEVEWISDDPGALDVRVHEGSKYSKSQIRSWILSRYSTRKELLEWCLSAKNNNKYCLDLRGYEHPLPDGFSSVGGYLYLEGYEHPLPDGFSSVGGDLNLEGYEHPLPDGLKENIING